MTRRLMAGTLIGLAGGIAETAAGQTVGPEFRINEYTTQRQYQPAVAADGDGNFVAVWNSMGQDGSQGTVMGRRFDRLGNPRGSEFRVNTYTTAWQGDPALAIGSDGGFVVAWHSFMQGDDESGAFARRFDPAGTALGLSEFRANSYTTGNQGRSQVAYFPSGEFVVVWQSWTQDGHSYGIFGRRFDAAGGAAGSEFQINTHTTSNQMYSVLAASGDGFVVAWESFADGSSASIAARRFDSAGNPAGPEFVVNNYTTSAQQKPGVALDQAGAFVIVWTSNHDVFGQRFDAAGHRLGGEFLVNTYVTGIQNFPAIAMDPEGEFLVAWNGQDGNVSGPGGVFAQRFDAGGARIGGEFRLNEHTPSTQQYPAVASLGVSKFVVTWQSFAQDGNEFGVFGRRVGDLLFRDGFDTGDLSRWSASAADGGDLDVTLDAAMKFTTFGLQANVDDTNGLFVQDDTPKDETIYRARFYFHPGDFDPGESQDHRRARLFIAFEESPTRRLFALVLRRIDGQYSLMGRARRDDDTQANTVFVPITADAHFVELRWARATSPDALDGAFELWVDGVLQASNTTLDNAISAVDFVRLGALSVKTGASGALYFDEFESRRELPIGP